MGGVVIEEIDMTLLQTSIKNAHKRIKKLIIATMSEEHISYERVLHLLETSRIDEHLHKLRIEEKLLYEMEENEAKGVR